MEVEHEFDDRLSPYPATSLTISLTNAVLLLKWPLVRDILGLTLVLGSTFFLEHQQIELERALTVLPRT